VLEVELPTGYHMLESDAIDLARSGVHPTLREGLTVTGKTLWFFEHVSFFLIPLTKKAQLIFYNDAESDYARMELLQPHCAPMVSRGQYFPVPLCFPV